MARTEPRSDRSAERRLLTGMALAIIVTMAALGVLYLALWSGAADDLTRLLPASTRAYAAAPAPWAAMTRTLAMPIWDDPERMASQVLRDGYLAGERQGEIAGLPMETVRELLRTMDSLELALVPTSDGDTLLVFVELRDATKRKRVLSRLSPLLETVDRRVGFRVDQVRQRAWQALVGQGVDPPRMVDMEPWIILSWGSPAGLDDLLEARVEGRGNALAKREGFLLRSGGDGDLRLAVDASSAWRVLARARDSHLAPPRANEPPPGGLVEVLDLLTVEARVGVADEAKTLDRATLSAELTDREFAAMLARGLTRGPHQLAAIAPADALFVVSATGDDLRALVEVLRALAFRLQRDFEPSAGPEALATNLIAAATELPEGAGEIALVALPSHDPARFMEPLVLVRSTSIDALAERLATTLPERFGDGYAHGQVLHQGSPLFLEVAHDDGPDPGHDDGGDGGAPVRMAWRARNGVLEIANDVATLDRFAGAAATLASTPRYAAARLGLPDEAAIRFIADRRVLALPEQPLLALLSDRLERGFSFGMSLDVVGDQLVVRSNLGLWTLASAIASGSRQEIDRFALPGLEPRCREAYDAFCTAYPDAVPCRPFTLGRRARIEAVCAVLFATAPPGAAPK